VYIFFPFCFHYNENGRPRRPAKYFARSQKLTLILFLSFIQSSFDFAVKRERNRIELESEERKECLFSSINGDRVICRLLRLYLLVHSVNVTAKRFGYTRTRTMIDVDMIGNKFWMEFATRHPIEFFPFRSQFSHCPLGRMRNRVAVLPCATAHQRIGHHSEANSRKLCYYGSDSLGLANIQRTLIVSL